MSSQRMFSSALQVNLFTGLGFVAGCINQSLIAYHFGISPQFDAFNMAQAIPLFLNNILATTLSTLLIPYLSSRRAEEPERFPQYRASCVVLFGLFFAATALAVLLLSRQLIGWAYPQADVDVKFFAQSSLLSLIPFYIFSGMGTILVAVHNTDRKFLLTSAATLSVSFVTLSILAFSGRFGFKTLIIAANLAPLAQVLFLLYPLRHELKTASKALVSEELRYFTHQGGFLLMSQVFGQSAQPIIRSFASMLAVGTVSYFAYADKLYFALYALSGQVLFTIALPVFSDAAMRSKEELSQLFSKTVGMCLFLAAPVAVCWFLLSKEVVALLYFRGNFSWQDAEAVTRIMRVYTLQVYLSIAVVSLSHVYYATRQIKTIGKIWIAYGVVHVALAYLFTRHFQVEGLAASYGVTGVIFAVIMIYILNSKFEVKLEPVLFKVLGETLLAAAVCFVTSLVVLRVLSAVLIQNTIGEILRGLAVTLNVGFWYIFLMKKFDNKQMVYVTENIRWIASKI